MLLSRLKTTAAILFGAYSLVAITAQAKESASITISTLDAQHLKLEYRLPDSCKRIELGNPYRERTAAIRKEWLPLDHCGRISSDNMLNLEANCTTASFSIPIKASVMDQAYPTAYPFDEQGVSVHTGIFAMADTCGDIEWNFKTTKGAVIIDGTNRGNQTTIVEKQARFIQYTGVFLSYKPRAKNPSVIANAAAPAWLTQGVIKAVDEVTHYYKKTYPQLSFTAPALFISNNFDSKENSIDADVSSPRMVRISIFNAGKTPNDDYIKAVMRIVAHEFAHLLQAKNTESQPFVHEGGAEFIRWMTEYTLGWQDKNYLAQGFSDALASCLQLAEQKPWTSFEKENLQVGAAIYQCGLAVHIIGLASRQNPESAEETLHIYYQHWRAQPNTDFAQAIECGNVKDCKSNWLANLLSDNKSVALHINEQLNHLRLIKNNAQVTATNALANTSAQDLPNTYYDIDADQLLRLLNAHNAR